MLETQKLDEHVAIVTGAAQGIGKGIALVLAKAGARIVIGDIQDASGTVQEIRAAGGQAVSIFADTSKPRDGGQQLIRGGFSGLKAPLHQHGCVSNGLDVKTVSQKQI